MKQLLNIHRKLDAPQELILVRLLVTMGAASIVASSALYLQSLGMSDAAIGISTAFVMAVNLIFALLLPLILRRYTLTNILLGTTISFAATLLIFGNTTRAFIALLFYICARLVLSMFASSYSILFHDDSPSPKAFRMNQALSGSIINFAWMITPFFATLVIAQYSFATLYSIGAVMVLIAALTLLLQKVPEPVKIPNHMNIGIFRNIQHYFSQKRLRSVYVISTSVDMWWVFIFVFVTLYLKEAGFSITAIGVFLTLSQLPLFLLEFKSYIIVDKFKYRGPLILAYLFMSLSLFIIFLLGINFITLGILLANSIFLAFIEPAREMYLYDKLKLSEESQMQPVYATAEIVGSIIIRLAIGLVLLHFSQSVTFAVMAVIMASIALYSFTIEN